MEAIVTVAVDALAQTEGSALDDRRGVIRTDKGELDLVRVVQKVKHVLFHTLLMDVGNRITRILRGIRQGLAPHIAGRSGAYRERITVSVILRKVALF